MLSGMFLGTSATARAPECEKNTGAIDTSMASHVVWSVRECEGDFKMQNRALLQIPWYITEYHRISQNITERLQCFRPGSYRRPCACEAHVITTTLRKLVYRFVLSLISYFKIKGKGSLAVDIWVSVPGAFKLDHLQSVKQIFSQTFSNFPIFILEPRFLLTQRVENEKREFTKNG